MVTKSCRLDKNMLWKEFFEENGYMNRVKMIQIPETLSSDELFSSSTWWERYYQTEKLSYLIAASIKGHRKAVKKLGTLFCSTDAENCGIYNEEAARFFMKLSLEWYMELVKEDDVEGYYEVGLIYNSGKKIHYTGEVVIEKDLDLAEQYFRKGAEKGHDGCQLWLGLTLKEKGRNQEALEWFVKAGEQGQGWASYLAGEMYEKGIGVPVDRRKALFWYGESAKTDNFYAEGAREALKRLKYCNYN